MIKRIWKHTHIRTWRGFDTKDKLLLVLRLRQQMHWTKFIADCPNTELPPGDGDRELLSGTSGLHHKYIQEVKRLFRNFSGILEIVVGWRLLVTVQDLSGGLWWVRLKLHEEVWLAGQRAITTSWNFRDDLLGRTVKLHSALQSPEARAHCYFLLWWTILIITTRAITRAPTHI